MSQDDFHILQTLLLRVGGGLMRFLTNGPVSEKMLSSGDTQSGDTAFWVNFERAIMCGERIRSIWSETSKGRKIFTS